ncbi:hypothetical protein EJB05_09509, partial [Eragrostis curvula]
MLLAVSAGEYGVLLGLVGILVGANFIAVGVRMAEEPTVPPIGHSVFAAGVGGELPAFGRRNLEAAGVILASSAFTVVAGEASSELCFSMFALLLLGISLIIIGIRGE